MIYDARWFPRFSIIGADSHYLWAILMPDARSNVYASGYSDIERRPSITILLAYIISAADVITLPSFKIICSHRATI